MNHLNLLEPRKKKKLLRSMKYWLVNRDQKIKLGVLKNKSGLLQRSVDPVDIPWNPGWLRGILIMAYYNPHITG